MTLVRHFTLLTLKYNLVFKAEHISGIYNVIAGALSRLKVNKFRQLVPHTDPFPTPIPVVIWSLCSQQQNL